MLANSLYKVRLKISDPLIRTIKLLPAIALLLSSPTVLALSTNDLDSIYTDSVWYDSSATCAETSNASSSNISKSIYVIGDSITVGMKGAGLESKFTSEGHKVTNIQATEGINITNSLPKIDVDKNFVSNSDTVIVELGTNDARGASSSTIAERVKSMVQKLKSTNSALKIYWVNLYSTKFSVDEANSAINSQASPLGYTVIDWNKEARSNPDIYVFDDALGVHLTGNGYSAMGDFIVKSIGGQSTSISSTTVARGSTISFPLNNGTAPNITNAITANTSRQLSQQTIRGAQFAYAMGHKSSIGGIREDSIDDHPTGIAIDIHARDLSQAVPPGPEFDFLNSLAETYRLNSGALSVEYVIWNNKIASGRNNFQWRPYSNYEGSGSPSQRHTNHIHVSFSTAPGNTSINLYGTLGANVQLGQTTGSQIVTNEGVQNSGYSVSGCVCSVGISTSLSGNDNIEKALSYFISSPRSLTPEQSAGIVGNLLHESGLDPKQEQLNGGPGRGIAQWEIGGRWDVLLNWAKDNGGRDPLALDTQLDFVWYEMTKIPPWNETLPSIKAVSTVQDATRVFMEKYEKPGTPALESRISLANQAYKNYAGSADNNFAPASSDGSCGAVTPSGQNTRFVNGFTVYSQYDPDWVNRPYSSSTIGESGCGPAAMAMIITALTGRRVTPVDTANYAASIGMYIPGTGSSWSIGPRLAEHWGLSALNIGPASVARISASIQGGALILAAGKGPVPFSTGGHFIVIRAVTADGKWMVGNSGNAESNDIAWDPQQIVSSILANDGGSVYAISR